MDAESVIIEQDVIANLLDARAVLGIDPVVLVVAGTIVIDDRSIDFTVGCRHPEADPACPRIVDDQIDELHVSAEGINTDRSEAGASGVRHLETPVPGPG